MHRTHGRRLDRRLSHHRLEGVARCVAASVAFLLFPAIGLAASTAPWSKLPRMELERQFAGPLQDTIIQRWRDPADGTVCYIYLPITAQHSSPMASGYVQYGSNTIGTISCFEGKTPEKHVEEPARGKKKQDRSGSTGRK